VLDHDRGRLLELLEERERGLDVEVVVVRKCLPFELRQRREPAGRFARVDGALLAGVLAVAELLQQAVLGLEPLGQPPPNAEPAVSRLICSEVQAASPPAREGLTATPGGSVVTTFFTSD